MLRLLFVCLVALQSGCSGNTSRDELQIDQTLSIEILRKSHQIIVTESDEVILVFNPSNDTYNAYWDLLLFDKQLRFKDRTDFPSYWIYKVEGRDIFAQAKKESAQTGAENYSYGRRLGSYIVGFTDSLYSVSHISNGILYSIEIDTNIAKARLQYARPHGKLESLSAESRLASFKDSIVSEWVFLDQIEWIYPNKLTSPNGGIWRVQKSSATV